MLIVNIPHRAEKNNECPRRFVTKSLLRCFPIRKSHSSLKLSWLTKDRHQNWGLCQSEGIECRLWTEGTNCILMYWEFFVGNNPSGTLGKKYTWHLRFLYNGKKPWVVNMNSVIHHDWEQKYTSNCVKTVNTATVAMTQFDWQAISGNTDKMTKAAKMQWTCPGNGQALLYKR